MEIKCSLIEGQRCRLVTVENGAQVKTSEKTSVETDILQNARLC